MVRPPAGAVCGIAPLLLLALPLPDCVGVPDPLGGGELA